MDLGASIPENPADTRQKLPLETPTGANDRQHGGNHYKQMEYQHWDFVVDTCQPYLIGCATKYVSRWRRKNGIEDLRKAQHYLEKADERGVGQGMDFSEAKLGRFTGQLQPDDANVIELIMDGRNQRAIKAIQDIIDGHGDAGVPVAVQPEPQDLDRQHTPEPSTEEATGTSDLDDLPVSA
jgi:hypothetical protein